MWTRATILTLLLMTVVPFVELKKTLSYKTINFLKAETQSNTFYAHDYRMIIRKDRRIADIYLTLTRQLPMNLTQLITMKLKTSGKSQLPAPTMFEGEFRSCNFYAKNNARLLGFLMPFLKKSIVKSKFPQSCPIAAGNYTWIGLNLQDLKMPKFLPNSQYEVNVFTYVPKESSRELVLNTYLITEVK